MKRHIFISIIRMYWLIDLTAIPKKNKYDSSALIRDALSKA